MSQYLVKYHVGDVDDLDADVTDDYGDDEDKPIERRNSACIPISTTFLVFDTWKVCRLIAYSLP